MSISLQQQARRRYVPGIFGYSRVARELGVSPTTVKRLVGPGYAEHLRVLAREAKGRRTGICRECGGETRYNGRAVNGASELCAACSSARQGARVREETLGRGPTQGAALSYLSEGPARFREIRDELGLTSSRVGGLLRGLCKAGLVVRLGRGLYVLPEQAARITDPIADDASSPKSLISGARETT